jgi:PrtD family type I secretion system ABC transporter
VGKSMAESRSELNTVADHLRRTFFGIGLISLVINLLMLTGPLFMIAIYDHVIPTKNIDTLLGLSAICLAAYVLYGMVDTVRTRIMARLGTSFAEALSSRVFDAVLRQPLIHGFQADTVRPIRDLDEIRTYVSGSGMAAIFDVPWIPIYLGICFIFHPLIGFAVLFGAVVLVILTIYAESVTRQLSRENAENGSTRNAIVEHSIRNTEVLMAMGILIGIRKKWSDQSGNASTSALLLTDRTGALLELSKVARMVLQSGVLALGAFLVVNGLATAGVIIASSILSSRALAPIDQIIGSWRSLLSARQGWARIAALLDGVPAIPEPLRLPAPTQSLNVENVSLSPPGSRIPTLNGISFEVPSGSAVGVLGPSGAGKSSLIRTVVGIWQTSSGAVRIDGADVQNWSLEQRRSHIGYLPQDVELLDGTIAQNIARFDDTATPESIIEAARQAKVHELVLRLPQGYDTKLGPNGMMLSGGQKQRVALARALYGNPFLVVLDEPNSNLDAEGETALSDAITAVRERGGIVLIVAHRETALSSCDRILIIQSGQVRAYGLKEELLRPRVTRIEAVHSRQSKPDKPAELGNEEGAAQ